MSNDEEKQKIIINNTNVQNNNGGLGGCFSGCGNLIAGFIAIGFVGALLGQFGGIVLALAGFFLGAWAGIFINNNLVGVSKTAQETMDEINSLDWDKWSEWDPYYKSTVYWAGGLAVACAIGGWIIGASIAK